jgi:hypothetical protein
LSRDGFDNINVVKVEIDSIVVRENFFLDIVERERSVFAFEAKASWEIPQFPLAVETFQRV